MSEIRLFFKTCWLFLCFCEMYFVVQKIIRTFANGMGMKRILFLHGFYASGQCVPAKAISEKTSEKTSEKFTVTDRTIESDLAHLKIIGILVREGGRKDGKWVIIIENKEAT